jgi:hypothetical protein
MLRASCGESINGISPVHWITGFKSMPGSVFDHAMGEWRVYPSQLLLASFDACEQGTDIVHGAIQSRINIDSD